MGYLLRWWNMTYTITYTHKHAYIIKCTNFQLNAIISLQISGIESQGRAFERIGANRMPIFQYIFNIFPVFSCDQATLWMVQSVRVSVCLSVRPSYLFDYVPIIVSSEHFQELLPTAEVTSMQKVEVRGQRSRSQRSHPNVTVSLNSHMIMKWCI